jgi:hypothetical protein
MSANARLFSFGGEAMSFGARFGFISVGYAGSRTYCEEAGLAEASQLCLLGVLRFTRTYTGPRLKGNRSASRTCDAAQNAIHAWACALRSLGETLPPWHDQPKVQVLSPLMNEYRDYRCAHNGAAEGTLIGDLDVAQRFIKNLQARNDRWMHLCWSTWTRSSRNSPTVFPSRLWRTLAVRFGRF